MILEPLLHNAERKIDRALFPGGLGMLSDLAFRAERHVAGPDAGARCRDEYEDKQTRPAHPATMAAVALVAKHSVAECMCDHRASL